jgi:ubiquinone/menaquinone biosynthesis C-methylase UbiE
MSSQRSAKTPILQKALEILELRSGSRQRVLDIGCGTGELLGHVATVLGDGAGLVGLDEREDAILEAKTAHSNIEFIRYQFHDRLPFPDEQFHVVVSVDAIECIQDKDALIGEIHRVLKPRGKVLAMHWDWDTQTYNVSNRNFARRAVWAFSDWKQPWMGDCDGQMGRKLWGLFEGSKKFHGRPEAVSLLETEYMAGRYGFDRVQDMAALVREGEVDQTDYEALRKELSASSANGRYFYSVTSFIYFGEKI